MVNLSSAPISTELEVSLLRRSYPAYLVRLLWLETFSTAMLTLLLARLTTFLRTFSRDPFLSERPSTMIQLQLLIFFSSGF